MGKKRKESLFDAADTDEELYRQRHIPGAEESESKPDSNTNADSGVTNNEAPKTNDNSNKPTHETINIDDLSDEDALCAMWQEGNENNATTDTKGEEQVVIKQEPIDYDETPQEPRIYRPKNKAWPSARQAERKREILGIANPVNESDSTQNKIDRAAELRNSNTAICPIGQPQVDKFGPEDAGKRVLFGAPFQPANPHFKPNGNERRPQPAIPKRVGNQANPSPSQGQGRTLEFTNIDELRKMRQSGQMNMAPGNRNSTNNPSPSNQMQLNKKDNNNAAAKAPGVSIEFNSIDELRNSLKRASAHKEISDQPLNIGANQMAVKNDHMNATPVPKPHWSEGNRSQPPIAASDAGKRPQSRLMALGTIMSMNKRTKQSKYLTGNIIHYD